MSNMHIVDKKKSIYKLINWYEHIENVFIYEKSSKNVT